MIKVTDKKNCCGCGACSVACPKGCIDMQEDENGFLCPVVNEENCINCSLCEKTCPLLKESVDSDSEIDCYAAYNLDEDERMKSSSGGIFIVLAEEILLHDGVIFGASFDDNLKLKHTSAKKLCEAKAFMGSKYLQSRTVEGYKEAEKYLEDDKFVLFSGTPCQVEGLKAYLGKEYENLLLVDLVCHGVPSTKVFRYYLKYMKEKYGQGVKKIEFRNKKEGWDRVNVRISFEDGSEVYERVGNNLFMRAFGADICLRESCYDCKFKSIPKQSDITLADFWGYNKILNKKDNTGVSLIFVNTAKGRDFLEKINDKIHIEPVDADAALKYNPSAIKSAPKRRGRNKFLKQIGTTPFEYAINKYCKVGMKRRIKRILFGVKRVFCK